MGPKALWELLSALPIGVGSRDNALVRNRGQGPLQMALDAKMTIRPIYFNSLTQDNSRSI